MKNKKQYITLLSLLGAVATFQGCVQKSADGTYPSVYSYHPYENIHYVNNRVKQPIKRNNVSLGRDYQTVASLKNNENRYNQRTQQAVKSNNVSLGRQHQTVISAPRNYQPFQYERQANTRRGVTSYSAIANQIESIAKSHLNKPYRWAANGPHDFDCSGFTKSVFSNNGIELPRRAKEQAKVGQYVTKNQLRKGDLVFFDSSKSAEIGHVGIYLGNGAFIHASSSKHKVVIGTIDSGYHSKHFKWGRRLTPNQNNGLFASR